MAKPFAKRFWETFLRKNKRLGNILAKPLESFFFSANVSTFEPPEVFFSVQTFQRLDPQEGLGSKLLPNVYVPTFQRLDPHEGLGYYCSVALQVQVTRVPYLKCFSSYFKTFLKFGNSYEKCLFDVFLTKTSMAARRWKRCVAAPLRKVRSSCNAVLTSTAVASFLRVTSSLLGASTYQIGPFQSPDALDSRRHEPCSPRACSAPSRGGSIAPDCQGWALEWEMRGPGVDCRTLHRCGVWRCCHLRPDKPEASPNVPWLPLPPLWLPCWHQHPCPLGTAPTIIATSSTHCGNGSRDKIQDTWNLFCRVELF